MNPIFRNILAFIAAFIGGSLVNGSLITLGHKIFPIEGVNPDDMEALAEVMPTLSAEYFLYPFIAHALGTLIGGLLLARIAASSEMKLVYGYGALSLFFGIIASLLIPAPTWFVLTDLLLAYLPMAIIGGKIGLKSKA